MSFKLVGVTPSLAKMAAASAKIAAAARAGLYTEASILLTTKIKPRTPMSQGGGKLRGSGHVTKPEQEGTTIIVRIVFGTEYAVAVHEHLSEHSPPSWVVHGEDINWRLPGTGPKFVENPMNEVAPVWNQMLGSRIKLIARMA